MPGTLQGQAMVVLKMATAYSKPTEASFLLSTLCAQPLLALWFCLGDETTVSSHTSALHRLKSISKSWWIVTGTTMFSQVLSFLTSASYPSQEEFEKALVWYESTLKLQPEFVPAKNRIQTIQCHLMLKKGRRSP